MAEVRSRMGHPGMVGRCIYSVHRGILSVDDVKTRVTVNSEWKRARDPQLRWLDPTSRSSNSGSMCSFLSSCS